MLNSRDYCKIGEEDIEELVSLVVKDTFEDVMHDVKNCITVCSLGCGALKNEIKNNETAIEIMKTTMRNINRAIKMLIEYCAKIVLENTGTKTYYSKKDIVSVLLKMKEDALVLGVSKGIRIEFETNVASKEMLIDDMKFYRVLFNLVVNAVKFGKNDGILKIIFNDYGDKVIIEVCDNGEGLPEDMLEAIFEKRVTSNSTIGEGLGLTVVKNFVELFGGTIYATNCVVLKGAKFVIELPVYSEDALINDKGPATLFYEEYDKMWQMTFAGIDGEYQ